MSTDTLEAKRSRDVELGPEIHLRNKESVDESKHASFVTKRETALKMPLKSQPIKQDSQPT